MKKNSSRVSTIKDSSCNQWVQSLLLWFQVNKRDLPWRENRNPYYVWISEIMLQQTRVVAVIPYFKRFIKKYPSVEDLARASLKDIYKAWEGLGYYSRAANIHSSANTIVEEYGGNFPLEHKQLLALKGIGEYTAGAIMSLAYNEYYPAVDGNVLRVISRLIGSEQNILDKSFKDMTKNYLQISNPKGHARDFTEALMELGALICDPVYPKCTKCPLVNDCIAYKEEKQSKIPVRIKRQTVKTLKMSTFIIECHSEVLLQKRSNESMMKNLFGYPTVNVFSKTGAQKEIKRILTSLGIQRKFSFQQIGIVSHEYSHQKWNSKVYFVEIMDKKSYTKEQLETVREETVRFGINDLFWVSKYETDKYPISRFFRKIEELLKDK